MWWLPVSEAVVDLQHKGSTQQIQRGPGILQGQIKYIHDPGEAISQRIFMYAEFFCCIQCLMVKHPRKTQILKTVAQTALFIKRLIKISHIIFIKIR